MWFEFERSCDASKDDAMQFEFAYLTIHAARTQRKIATLNFGHLFPYVFGVRENEKKGTKRQMKLICLIFNKYNIISQSKLDLSFLICSCCYCIAFVPHLITFARLTGDGAFYFFCADYNFVLKSTCGALGSAVKKGEWYNLLF